MQGRDYGSEYAELERLRLERRRVRLLLAAGLLLLVVVLGSLWMALASGQGRPAELSSWLGFMPWSSAAHRPKSTGCFAMVPEPPEQTALIQARIKEELGGALRPSDELNLKLDQWPESSHGVVLRPNGRWYHFYNFLCGCGHWQLHPPDTGSSMVLKDQSLAQAYYHSSNCELCQKEWHSRETEETGGRR